MSAFRRSGIALVLAGVLVFAGQAGELVFGSPSDLVDALFVVLLGGGIVALVVAFGSLRAALRGSRAGQVSAWLGLAGSVLLVLFAVQATIEVARTGEVPENFILFALGFLLLLVAHAVLVFPLRRLDLGLAWALPLVTVAGVIVALAFEVDPVHDIGLFIVEASWIALGGVLLRSHAATRKLAPAS